MTGNDLGEFLRAHRSRLRPGDVGLPSYDRRRVTGLRREEVAVLAGMNSDYYARLEHAGAPAFVLNPAKDFVGLNALAEALFSPFGAVDNLARMTFLDLAARRFFVRWERFAESVVAGLRHAHGLDPEYPRLRELVRSLSEESDAFAALWSSHAVYGKTQEATELLHPDVGPLALVSQSFDVRGAPGQILVIYQADSGSRSADALILLGALHATSRP
ncbi:helix-turn-helix domain-containing protein [Actinoplanes sp. M2I2]|uniref:MmyB family transcriptional regulator n=1 Tax=Actinoplanes sp. M2I2 TaxID=1734444 RepID=UPI0020220A72|nr:helix-turn-helix domain-containing protein [Actinoplanes sp. M2I2]